MAARIASLEKLRERWIWHWKRELRRLGRWVRWDMCGPFHPKPLPEICEGLICGAKTRSGTPCKRRDMSKSNGRCRMHGGHSTGPRTQEGKDRCKLNLVNF